MKRRRVESLDVPPVPLNFLLSVSDITLGSYELKKLNDIANIRDELLVLLDKYVEEMAQAALTRWFRGQDREAIKRALESPDDALAWAKERVRNQQRSGEELIPRTALPPGKAHIAASLRYQERNIAAGRCGVCPQPLARHSVRYCEKHLEKARLQHPPKGAIGDPPGSIGYLYGDGIFRSAHGKAPASVKALKDSREKQTKKKELR
jgi:hypothetical protein